MIPKNFKDVTDKKGKLNVLDRFNWVFRSQKARSIMQKMESLKSTLTVMLSALQTARMQRLIS